MVRIAFSIITLILTSTLRAQEFKDLFVSNEGGVACYRIPAITKAKNGDLIVAIDERIPSCADLRGNDDINIVIRRSQDNGETWTNIESIVDFPKGLSASDPSFIVDQKSANIFLFYNFMDLNTAPNIYKFHYVLSSDNGQSWSQPIDITNQISPPQSEKDFQFITSGQGTQNEDGLLLHTLVNLDKGVFIFGSEDGGKSWQIFGTAIQPGDESKIITLDNGQWMVNSRVNKSGLRYIHLSDDYGQSWSTTADSTLIDPSCNAGLLKLKDGDLLFSNAFDNTQRKNLVLKKSVDHGKTWNIVSKIYNGQSAYSDIVELESGEIGVVFEKDDYKKIVFIKVKI